MKNNSTLFTLDASVFIKIIIEENDTELTRKLLQYMTNVNVTILNPTLFEYEIHKICISHNIALASVTKFLEMYKNFNLELIYPSLIDIEKAKKIIDSCKKESGLPSFYDVIYHAIAINNNSTFITADKKYYEKTKDFGSIITLDSDQVASILDDM